MCHEGDKLSDHSSVSITLDIQVTMSGCEEEVPQSPRIKWDAASALELLRYDQKLDQLLGIVTMPWSALNCCDYFCAPHNEALQDFYDDIVRTCLDSAKLTIPSAIVNKSIKSIPGLGRTTLRKKGRALFLA